MDHAAVAPLPARARDALHEWADSAALNGVCACPRWLERIEDVRRAFGVLLNTDPLDLAFVKNTSEGIAFVAEGYPWQAGDNLITAAEEYPSNLYPWLNLASRGVEVRQVPSRGNRIAIDDINERIDGRTRLLSLSFVEFGSGFRNDLDALAALCRERGVHFFVDAIQGMGVLPLDLARTPIDFLSADGHKWLLGPEGAGVFYVRREVVDLLRPISVGWNSVVDPMDFSNIDLQLKPHAGRWENGTLNVPGVHALGASLELLLELGIDKVCQRIDELTEQMSEQARRKGLDVFSSRAEQERSGIVSLTVPGVTPKEAVKRCRQAKIAAAYRAGRVRLSPHCYNSPEEIDFVVETLAAARS